ncbi:MAG: hypothetical protein O3C10_00585 [Chloroflexi bacterium]|nr:hypothetical protein [Chloroflexota bacterium]
MIIGSGEHGYEWIDGWAKIPDSLSARDGWAHPGMAVAHTGEIFTVHPGESTVLVFDPDGTLKRSFEAPAREVHQMAVASDGRDDFLWIADPGRKNVRAGGMYEPSPGEWGGQVLQLTFDGDVVSRIERPDHAVYSDGTFAPTAVSVFQLAMGGNGDIWVADGYGESYLHRYNSSGDYLGSVNGEEGRAGRFACPHAVWVDYRKSEPELLIADRTNRRVQVYDLEGQYKRHFGADVMTSPSSFAVDGEQLIVAELRARLTVFDIDDNFVCYTGENERIARVDRNSPEDVPGWPNNLDENGNVIRSRILEPGSFNSPHGVAVDNEGNIYVAEWLVGGRYTKLVKQRSSVTADGGESASIS